MQPLPPWDGWNSGRMLVHLRQELFAPLVNRIGRIEWEF
jgi:hypothetical protein